MLVFLWFPLETIQQKGTLKNRPKPSWTWEVVEASRHRHGVRFLTVKRSNRKTGLAGNSCLCGSDDHSPVRCHTARQDHARNRPDGQYCSSLPLQNRMGLSTSPQVLADLLLGSLHVSKFIIGNVTFVILPAHMGNDPPKGASLGVLWLPSKSLFGNPGGGGEREWRGDRGS